MSINNKHLLAVAIVGSLASLSAQAQVTLGVPATTAPVVYASEITVPANTALTNAGNILDIVTPTRYAFSQGEVRHARIACDSNIRFDNVNAPVLSGATGVIGNVNGLGSNAISFSITATAATGIGTAATITVTPATTGTGITLTSRGNASCTYGLYDQPSQANNGGTTGLIVSASGAYIAFATTPSYGLTATGANATASVGATPVAFSQFIPGGTGTGAITAAAAPLGNINWALATPARFNTNGLAITLAALLATGPAGSAHVINGNFTALANTAGAFSATGGVGFGSVFIATGGDCAAPVGQIFPDALNATSATFRNTGLIHANAAGFVCFVQRTGAAIPAAGPYTIQFNAVSANAAVFTVSNVAPVNLGTISRDGAQLVAPLAQIPPNWLSRIVLNNTGPSAPVSITLNPGMSGSASELTSTFTGAATFTGTLAAGTNIFSVADLFPVANFTGPPRGTITVTVSTPRGNVNGLYQIVNPASGSISNHVMVAPGTN